MLKRLTYPKVFILNYTILTVKENNDNKCLSVFEIIYINNKIEIISEQTRIFQ